MDISNAPKAPGCYLFKNSSGAVIYVGKAKNLHRRVRQYFSKTHDPKDKLFYLVKEAVCVEYRLTDSELDALILEYRLIKQLRPWFNTQLKRDVAHPFLKIDTSLEYPALYPVYEKDTEEALYYGVFYREDDLNETLDLMQRVWKTPACGKRSFASPGRPCLNSHIGRCAAPCSGTLSAAAYQDIIREVCAFLDTGESPVIDDLRQKLSEYSETLAFEKAAECKRKLDDLEQLKTKARRAFRLPEDKDAVIAIRPYRASGVSLFYIHKGAVVSRRDFDGPPGMDDLKSFLSLPWEEGDKALAICLTEIYADKLLVVLDECENKAAERLYKQLV